MLKLSRQNALRERYRAGHPQWQPATERFAALVGAHLTPSARLLDLGCGRGGLVEQLKHPLQQVVGIDPDWYSLAEHRLPLPRAAATGQALPLPARSFDIVYASWVLEHLERPTIDFLEIARVLRPGGVFLFVTPNRRHPLVGLNRIAGRAARLQSTIVRGLYGRDAGDTFPAYYRANTRAAVDRLATTCGFTVDLLETVPDPTYLAFSDALFAAAQRLEQWLGEARWVHLVGVLRRSS